MTTGLFSQPLHSKRCGRLRVTVGAWWSSCSRPCADSDSTKMRSPSPFPTSDASTCQALPSTFRSTTASSRASTRSVSWVTTLRRHRLPTDTLWVSHVSDAELATLHRRHPQTVFRPRIGTALWLGARDTYRARGTVLASHVVRRGQRFGYRQRRAAGDGHLLIIGGGTSHGVALSAPRAVAGALPRIKLVAEGGLEAGGRALSPFHVGDRRRWFAEPPHMQVSMVWLPSGVSAPVIGDSVAVDVRMTTATFDRVVLH